MNVTFILAWRSQDANNNTPLTIVWDGFTQFRTEIPLYNFFNSLTNGLNKISMFFGPFGPGNKVDMKRLSTLYLIDGGRFKKTKKIGHTE